MKKVVLLLVVAFLTALGPAVARALYDERLYRESYAYAAALGLRQPDEPAEALLSRARAAAQEGRWVDAVPLLEAVAGGRPEDAAPWLELAQALSRMGEPLSALRAAYYASTNAASTQERAAALRQVAALAEAVDRWEFAIDAYAEILVLAPTDAASRTRRAELVRQEGFRIAATQARANQDRPEICITFTAPIADSPDVHPADFLAIDPATPVEPLVDGRHLCLQGIENGRVYEVTVLSGLPSADGRSLRRSESFTIEVADRPPLITFAGAGRYVLAAHGEGTAPLTTVNVARVDLQLLRVPDRNLVGEIVERRLADDLWWGALERIEWNTGELVWRGSMPVGGAPNRTVTTAIPVAELLADTGPGIYVLAAWEADDQEGEGDDDGSDRQDRDVATQWIVSSDLGILTFAGMGLDVAVRSLRTGLPVPGATVTLLARNNAVLGEATADAGGLVSFPAGLTRGPGGNRPAAVLVRDAGGDLNLVDLTLPALDLSDRGVGGRTPPGPLDAYAWTERGVYRPGETVHLTALLRTDAGLAVAPVPLTLKLTRPDGLEVEARVLAAEPGGAYAADIQLAETARSGTWHAAFHVDPDAGQVGEVAFQVESFVPQRIRMRLEAGGERIAAGAPLTIDVDAQFLYGAPAAGLQTAADIVVRPAALPFADWPGHRFGLEGETLEPVRKDLAVAPTRTDGRTSVSIALDDLPETTLPLEAEVAVSVFDVGGRPVGATMVLPVAAARQSIGLRRRDDVQVGEEAAVEVIVVDGSGRRMAAPGLEWSLAEVEYSHEWYRQHGSWRWRHVHRDRIVARGTIDVPQARPAILANRIGDGRYRLTVTDPVSGAASSLGIAPRWWRDPRGSDSPDALNVSLDAAGYGPGATARAFIEGPFAGPALVVVANDRVRWSTQVVLAAGGTTVDIPIDGGWGVGAYVLATAFRPAGEGPGTHGPGRAVGVGWMDILAPGRQLAVAIAAPGTTVPRAGLDVAVTVAGIAPGGQAWVTLSAVDEGILGLTGHPSPDPGRHFHARRALALDLRDVWGRLILDGGTRGRLRSGGDADRDRGLAVQVVRTVALHSGIVEAGPDGRAHIRLDIPDHAGELRLMAVAWTSNAVGAASRPLVVRDPVVASIALPRFLGPGDRADAMLAIDTLDGPPGRWHVRVEASGPILIAGVAVLDLDLDLGPGQSFRRVLPVAAHGVGVAGLTLRLEGPGNVMVERRWEIEARAPQLAVTERLSGILEPGGTVLLDERPLAPFVAGTAHLAATFALGPELDTAGRLDALRFYPYGCLEQTTSQGLARLLAGAPAAQGRPPGAVDMDMDVQRAVHRVLGMQRRDGSFGMWSANDQASPWASAWAAAFLTRARGAGHGVPEGAWRRAQGFLLDFVNRRDIRDDCDPAAAHALHALALGGAVDAAVVRSWADACLAAFPTPIARAQVGAALALVGDEVRSARAFEEARAPRTEPAGSRDYGSELRDRAAVAALMAEAGRPLADILDQADQAARLLASRQGTSTQEDAWLLAAGLALEGLTGSLELTLDGTRLPPGDGSLVVEPDARALARGVEVGNAGSVPVLRTISVRGVPLFPLPADANAMRIERHYYDRDGTELDLEREGLMQNDLVIVVINGTLANWPPYDRQPLVVDLLPAGLEIENPRIGGRGGAELAEMIELTPVLHAEARDDRFVAAPDLEPYVHSFAVGYVARAVTPGSFVLPAALAEDMYRPEIFARTAQGRLVITPAGSTQ